MAQPQGAVDSADRCIQQHLTTQGQKSARLRTVYKRAATPSASMSSKYISATPNSSSEQVRRAKRDKQAPQQRFPSFASPWRACRRRRAREPMAISHGTLSYIMQCDQTMRLALWPPRQVGRLFGGVAAAVDSAATVCVGGCLAGWMGHLIDGLHTCLPNYLRTAGFSAVPTCRVSPRCPVVWAGERVGGGVLRVVASTQETRELCGCETSEIVPDEARRRNKKCAE